MNNIYIYICLLCGLLMTAANLSGQVTIGSDKTPNKGTLLDLKEKDTKGVNSTRGLLLPRVYLTDMKNLFPMLEADNDYTNNINGAKDDQDVLHSGLTVYNTNECFFGSGVDKGVYVWSSLDWKRLGKAKDNESFVNVHLDQESNQFRSRVFGDAGEWMLENVKATKYASKLGGAAIATTGWKYPNESQAQYTERPAMGLLYNWATAMNGGDGTRQTQGVCPNGWHIPSDSEWNLLETEIYNKVNTYSNVVLPALNPVQWNVAWDAADNAWRGSSTALGHGNAMKAICPVPGIATSPAGNSSVINKGGFNALLAGVIVNGAATGYGSQTDFWSSTTYPNATPHAINRTLSNLPAAGASNQVRRNASSREYMMSIRCKLDEGFANCGDLLIDKDGNSYPTVNFGGVCWTTQNLRSTQGLVATTDYVEPTSSNNKDEYGLLYSWKAATGATASDILLAGEPGTTLSEIEGVCPDGWYLPSDKDWSELEKYMDSTPHNHIVEGSYVGPAQWSPYVENNLEWRPGGNYGWGEFMKLPTSGQPAGTATGWGYSKDSSSGFAAIFTGSEQTAGSVEGFLTHTNFWSSTEVFTPVTSGGDAARYRGLSNAQFNVYRGNASKTAKLSVRCIKRGF